MRYKPLAVKLFVIAIFALVGFFNIGGCGSSVGEEGSCNISVEFFGPDPVTSLNCDILEVANECNSSEFFPSELIITTPDETILIEPAECLLFGCRVGCEGPD